jgi:hypothetical protein
LRFQRRKKNSSDQPQARGAAPELRPLPRPPRHSPGHGKPSTAPVSAVHSPVSKDQSNNNPLRSGRGLGAPSLQAVHQPMPAMPGASVPALHAQCLRPTSADWRDRTPSRRRRGRAADHQELASPCVGASNAGGSLRVASAMCELQPQLVPRRQSEAGAPKRMGANRYGGRWCHPRWGWKSPFEIERIQGRL